MPSKTSSVSSSSGVELRTVTALAASPLNRTLTVKDSVYQETMVETQKGQVMVAHAGLEGLEGGNRKPVILTFHDLGLNYISNFQVIFFVLIRGVARNFSLGGEGETFLCSKFSRIFALSAILFSKFPILRPCSNLKLV